MFSTPELKDGKLIWRGDLKSAKEGVDGGEKDLKSPKLWLKSQKPSKGGEKPIKGDMRPGKIEAFPLNR